MRGAVTGTHGLIGSALVQHLTRRGDEVVRLVRGEPRSAAESRWEPDSGHVDTSKVEGLDYVVHLAGANIGARPWTPAQRRRIKGSRVKGTAAIARALAGLETPPSVFVSASANGFYGDGGDEELTEEAPAGEGFRAEVCVAWEAATRRAEDARIRVVHLRSGIVLAPRGGLLPYLSAWKIVPRIGSGEQFWSWISIEDEVGAIDHLIRDSDDAGPVNLTAPEVPRQRDFARTLADVKRGIVISVPGPVMQLVLGPARAREVLLSSERVVPAKLLKGGYRFRHPELRPALEDIYRRVR